jgi:hypothetical protein
MAGYLVAGFTHGSWIASFGTSVVLMLVAVTMLHMRHSKAAKAQA